MSAPKIQSTKNYAMFTRSDHNRETNVRKRKKLRKSMQQYGFLKCFPIVARRENGKLVVKDGQHRLAIAESLGLAVHYVEEDVDFDIATINSSPEKWTLKDYANTYAKMGHKQYAEGIEFSENHSLPLGISFALLAGVSAINMISDRFAAGEFVVKDRKWADDVAAIYGPIVKLSAAVNNARFIQACMACARVQEFEPKRMVQCAERCRDRLVAYSTREAYLDMMEQIYNFGRAKLFGLKIAATMAMRERNLAVNPTGAIAQNGRLAGGKAKAKLAVAGK